MSFERMLRCPPVESCDKQSVGNCARHIASKLSAVYRHSVTISLLLVCLFCAVKPAGAAAPLADSDFVPSQQRNFALASLSAHVADDVYDDVYDNASASLESNGFTGDNEEHVALVDFKGLPAVQQLILSSQDATSLLDKIAFITSNVTLASTDPSHAETLASASMQAMVGWKWIHVDGRKKRLVSITFRGTEGTEGNGLIDWAVNATANPDPWNSSDPDNKVHRGFFACARLFDSNAPNVTFTQMTETGSQEVSLQDMLDEARADDAIIWISGHSLGGAVATLYGARLIDPAFGKVPRNNVVVYTFGSPSVGNANFRSIFWDAGTGSLLLHRTREQKDIVPYAAYLAMLTDKDISSDLATALIGGSSTIPLLLAYDIAALLVMDSTDKWPYQHIGYLQAYDGGAVVSPEDRMWAIEAPLLLVDELTNGFAHHMMKSEYVPYADRDLAASQGTVSVTDALTSGSSTKYYQFSISQPSYVALNFKHASNGSSSSYWQATVQSADGQSSYLYKSIAGNATDTTKYVGLPQGSYQVRVTSGTYWDGRDYALNVSASPGSYEQEKNENLDSATTLALGTGQTGSLQDLPSGSDVDYYRFTLSQPGNVALNFKHTSNGSSSSYWQATVQSGDGQSGYLYKSIAGNEADTTKYVGLPQGSYLVKVTSGTYWDDRDYTLTVSATPGNYEQEKNETLNSANTLALGTGQTGRLQDLPSGSDVDYYTFTLSQPGNVALNFKHTSNGSSSSYWQATVQSGDGQSGYLYKSIAGNEADTTKYVGLPQGSYLVKVTSGTYWDDRDYTLTVSATPGNYEQEKNETLNSANTLALGTGQTGRLQDLPSGSDVDYYTFTLSQPGNVALNFKHTSNGSSSSYWQATVQSGDGQSGYLYKSIAGNEADTTKYVGLPQGSYLVKVTSSTYWDDGDYTLTVSATPGNYEQEKNETLNSANTLALGTGQTGRLQDLPSGSDVDYYKFTLSQPSYVALNFKHTSNGSSSSYWQATVQSADGQSSYLYKSIAGNATDTTEYVGLPQGSYLVKVTSSTYWDDRDYTLTVSATPGNFEQEQNETLASATALTPGTPYTGSLQDLPSGSDLDYYTFTLSQPSYVALNFKHESNGSNSSYWQATVQSADGQSSYLYKSIAGNATDTTKYVGLPQGSYLVKVTSGTYWDDRDYTLTVSATPGSYEQEKNETINSATVAALGTTYTGSIETLPSGSDVDYYRFAISQADTVRVNFRHGSNGSSSSYWQAAVLSADGQTTQLSMSIAGYTTDTMKYVDLPAGTYLVKVTQGTYGDDRDYSLTVGTAPKVSDFGIPVQSSSLTVPVTIFTATDNVAVTGYLVTETPTAPSATGGGWSATAPASYSFTTSGAKTLYAWAKNAAGNISASKAAAVNIDTPPVVTIFRMPSTSSSLTVAITSLSTQDDNAVTGYLVTETSGVPSLDAPGWSSVAPTSYTFDTMGTHTVYAFARDVAGNISAALAVHTTNSWTLAVRTAGTGSGAVNSTPAGIACTSGSTAGCNGHFSGGDVKLIATASADSTFAGWSGSCTDASICSITMDSNEIVTATFTLAPIAKIGSMSYATLQAAYDAAANDEIIQMKQGTVTGSLIANRPITVTVRGGYDAAYNSAEGETVIDGQILLRGGDVRSERVKVQ